MKKTNLRNKVIIGTVLLVFTLAVFYKTLFKGYVFAWYNDQLFQHNVFYKEWFRIIEESINNKTLAVYSWNTFLGTDYLATKLMYCVGDFLITPYFIVRVLLAKFLSFNELNFDLLYAITTIISIVLSGVNVSLYLDEFGTKKSWLNIALSIVYALGGFACIYSGSYMFHRFYTLLPLLFCFLEKYLKNGKVIGFTIVTALLFMQSYELLFSTCFFLVLYFIFTEKLKSDTALKDILKKSVKLILAFITGILLCGIFLVPLVLYLKTNQRVGSFSNDGIVFSFRAILGLLTNYVLPTFNLRSETPLYLFNSRSYYVQEYGFYVTLIILLAFILLFRKGNRKEKELIFGSETIILLCLIIEPINSIIHGFSVPTFRWSFVLALFHIAVSAYVLEKYEYDRNNIKSLVWINLVYLALYVLYVAVYKVDIQEYGLSILANTVPFIFVYVYDLLLKKSLYKAFTIFACINVMLFYVLTLSQYGIYGTGKESYDHSVLEYQIENDENKLARYYLEPEQLWPYSYLNLNESVASNYCGVSTYDSTYQSVLGDFLVLNGYDTWMIDIDNYELLNMLGVKYYVLSEDTDVLENTEVEHCNNFSNYKVYKDSNYNHIGYTVSSFVSEKDSKDVKWGSQLIIHDEDYDKVCDIEIQDKADFNVIEYNRQYMKGSVSVSGKSILFVAIPYSDGWNVVDQNGSKLETINVNEGFLGVFIDVSVQELSFYYGTPGLKAGVLVSGIGFVCAIALILKDRKIKVK